MKRILIFMLATMICACLFLGCQKGLPENNDLQSTEDNSLISNTEQVNTNHSSTASPNEESTVESPESTYQTETAAITEKVPETIPPIKTLEDFEKQISAKYKIDNFSLVRIVLSIHGNIDHSGFTGYSCMMALDGTYDNNGTAATWTKHFSISHDDFSLLYAVNDDYTVYNAEINDFYESIITDMNEKTLEVMCDNVFG